MSNFNQSSEQSFGQLLGEWKKQNQQLWKSGLIFGLNSKFAADQGAVSRVEAFINCVLQTKEPIHLKGKSHAALISITKQLHRKLSSTNGKFMSNFSNISFKGEMSNPLNLSIIKIHKDGKQISLESSKIEKIFSTEKETDGALKYINNHYELDIEKFLKEIKADDYIWDSYSTFIGEKGNGMHIYLKNNNNNNNSDNKENNSIFLDIVEKPLKVLWKTNYCVYLDNYELINPSQIEEKMREKALEIGENFIENNINNNSNSQELTYSETISTLSQHEKTLKWLDEGEWELPTTKKKRPPTKEAIYRILDKITLYKKTSGAKDIFFEFLKKTITDNQTNYHSQKGKGYPHSFEGDFAEVDSLVRARLALQKNENVKNIQIEVLGKKLGDNDKQVPADGKISFKYNNQDYTCTFQSKSYLLSTLSKAMYGEASFTLSKQENIDNNIHNTNLYAYPQKTLETGYNLITQHLNSTGDVLNETQQLLNPNIYIGAIPGLLRIKTYISNNEVLGRSDFYFISGYYIPSFLFLRLLQESLDKEKGENMIKISSTKNEDKKITNLVGTLSSTMKPIRVLDKFN